MIFLTSDLHIGHNKDFIYETRGFKSIEEHDKAIIKNWNNVVNDDDDVYVLGDLMSGDKEHGINCLKQLKGKIHIVIGNHDTTNKINLYKELDNVVEIENVIILKYNKYRFYLSHYPTVTTNHEENLHSALFNLYGHTHQTNSCPHFQFFPNFYCIDDFKINLFMYHVGVDSHNCTPIKLDDIIEEIRQTTSNTYQTILNNSALYNTMKKISCKKGDNHSENI